MNTPSSLPHRLRETSFRKYETVLAETVKRWPAPITVSPKEIDLSPTTYSARFRDAILSLQQYQWADTVVDMARFCQIADDIVVSHQGDLVIIGSAETVKPNTHFGGDWPINFVKHVEISSHEFSEALNQPSVKLVEATLLGLHHRIIQGPIRFTNVDILDSLMSTWESEYDVSVTLEPDGTLTLL